MILDLFCGAGGWSSGLDMLGIDAHDTRGIDHDPHAAATHQLAGFPTTCGDVTDVDLGQWGDVEGLTASPPCQDYSTAGNGKAGTANLTHTVPDAVAELRPTWIACEQVRAVLPIWRQHAHTYRQAGYHVWAGLLDASAFGVPQRRIRAVLIASLDSPVTAPHATYADGGLFGKRTVSAAEALGLSPGWSINRRQNSRGPGGTVVAAPNVPCYRPAPTVTGQAAGQWRLEHLDHSARLMTVRQLARLQSFPSGWPWQGNKGQQGQQVGNAIPPPLAAAVIRAATRKDARWMTRLR